MNAFWATFCKDLLVLRRDRAGLLVLFLMPAVLVLVISLVQNNVLQATGASGLRGVFIDRDGGALAGQVRQRLGAIDGLRVVEQLDGTFLTAARARRLVAAGDFQFGIIISKGTTKRLQQGARQRVREALRSGAEQLQDESPAPPLAVFFDPTVQGAFRTAVTSSLRQVLFGIEAAAKGKELSRTLNTVLAARSGGFLAGGTLLDAASLQQLLVGQPLLTVRQQAAAVGAGRPQPNAVQQNVPAWALFGMFFIVVPLSGALLRERQQGTLLRLRTLPAAATAVLLGKIAAFTAVCMVQFSLMLAVGKLFLPLLGTPEIDLAGRLPAAYGLALCAALAATGFGLLVGTAARSYEQASMFGAVSVVVAAALGGVMVPVYVMPRTMQAISAFSPLSWGLDGFLEIFVRGGGLQDIAPNACSLLAFFFVSVALSLVLFHRVQDAR